MFQSNPYYHSVVETLEAVQNSPNYTITALVGLFSLLLLIKLMASVVSRSSHYRGKPRRKAWYRGQGATMPRLVVYQGGQTTPDDSRIALRDPALQMSAIARAGFETQPLLNRSEARLLPALDAVVRKQGAGYRLMAQTCMGEILRPKRDGLSEQEWDAAFFAINAKRFDFAVFNRFGHLVVGIEYQGHGHYHSESFMRDAVKREVLRKAGVPFLELPAGISPTEAAEQLAALLNENKARAGK